MIEARSFIYIEPVFGFGEKVRYVTDTSDEKITCKSEDLYTLLKQEKGFNRSVIDQINTRIKCGISVVVDIIQNSFYEYDEADQVLLKKEVIRSSQQGDSKENLGVVNKRVEDLVKNKLFKE